MGNRVDQLFKNKLSGHTVSPSPEAWDKIQSSLHASHRLRMQRRLALAASVVLFVSAVGVGLYFLNQGRPEAFTAVSDVSKPSESHENNSVIESRTQIEVSKVKPDIQSQPTENREQSINPEQSDFAYRTSEKPMNEAKKDLPAAEKVVIIDQENVALLTEAVTQAEDVSETPEVPMEDQQLFAENSAPSGGDSEPTMTITITYKAGKDSKLVSPQKQSLFDEGVQKITGFAEERVLTDELKVKLRNTRDDLLALNFGKLITKQNKEN